MVWRSAVSSVSRTVLLWSSRVAVTLLAADGQHAEQLVDARIDGLEDGGRLPGLIQQAVRGHHRDELRPRRDVTARGELLARGHAGRRPQLRPDALRLAEQDPRSLELRVGHANDQAFGL